MRRSVLMVLVIVFALVASGCSEKTTDEKPTVVIGSKLFQESYILAHMAAIMLEDAGYKTDVIEGLGGTFVNYEALKKDDINTYVEYTGTAYSQILKEPPLEVWDPEVVYTETEKGLKETDKILIVSSPGFEDAYAIAVKEDWAEANNVTKISDLKEYASQMTIGTDPEFATREDGLPRIKDVYAIEFKDYKQAVATVMYEAIRIDDVDAISAYTTDTRNEVFNLRVLEDDKNALPPYDAIYIMTEEFATNNPDAVEALKKLDGRIDTDTMRSLNYKFDVDKMEPRDIAREFLIQEGLIEA
ncbi:glycine betaine ABC transporter substrate-binding protein [Methanomethylovorans sp. PtaU1.Bin093]|jgi:osmoprotectant transport system substrate-binding protein|uniref:glycine betaine ABC transporter substrate-binding protein n=1 Tax=Methanomethylovorans sp. PtaU1.Bin093 TaxID=1811679 RepID=UPI0025F805BA|nr:glycine betaine ABC transporter substrate-binding protein [Methanomethylovorans sp. PtaU1.Bin093]